MIAHIMAHMDSEIYAVATRTLNLLKQALSLKEVKDAYKTDWATMYNKWKLEGETKKGGEALLTEGGGSKKKVGAKPWKKFKGTCNGCGKQGHKKADCWEEKKKKQGEGSAKKDNGNSDGNKREDKRKCYKCQQVGHIAKDCPTKSGSDGFFVGCVDIDENSASFNWDAWKAVNREAWTSMKTAMLTEIKMDQKQNSFENLSFDEEAEEASSHFGVYAVTSEKSTSVQSVMSEDLDDEEEIPSLRERPNYDSDSDDSDDEEEIPNLRERPNYDSDSDDDSKVSMEVSSFEQEDSEPPTDTSDTSSYYMCPSEKDEDDEMEGEAYDLVSEQEYYAEEQDDESDCWYDSDEADEFFDEFDYSQTFEEPMVQEIVYCARTANEQETENEQWLMDSGASVHVTNNKKHMSNILPTDKTVKVGSGEELSAKEVGTVTLKNEKGAVLKLKQVYWVPSFVKNVISLTKLTDEGVKVTMEKSTLTLQNRKGGTLAIPKKPPETMFYFNGWRAMTEEEDQAMAVTGATSTMDINEAHRKLAHVSEGTLRKTMARFKVKLTGKLEPCFGCMQAKAKAKAVPKSTLTKADKPGERMFLDTTGPFPPSAGGSRYDIKMVDDYSGKTFGAKVARKTQLPASVKNHVVLLKGKGKQVKFIRCDNAGEQQGELEEVCREFGITLEKVAPNTPQMNGKVERKIVTDRSRALAMLINARLSPMAQDLLRAEAEATAEKMSNIACTPRQDKSPNEKFDGEPSKLTPEY